jgi:hypothetical protein
MNNDDRFVVGAMLGIGITGTIITIGKGKSPFKPIVSSLIAMVILGSLSTFAPQVAKGLAIVALIGTTYKYGPDLLSLLNGSGGTTSGGHF